LADEQHRRHEGGHESGHQAEHFGAAEASFVLSNLEPDQLALAKKVPVARRQLRGWKLMLVWSLRVYVVFMLVVVFWQAWLAVR
jgi:hypothetical protein